jgi:uncharacterized membrane protein YdjX (TVP38/TMEM64 family)
MQETATLTNETPESTRSPLPWARLIAAAVVLAVLFTVGREAGAYVPRFAAWVDGLGALGPLAFMAGYVVATVAFVPGSLLTLSAGAVFGIPFGVLYVFIGASVGATAAFLVSRYLARSAIEARLADNERFVRIDRAVAGQGLKIVTLLRLSPVFPFNLLNYALGLTQVRLRDYVVACLGMLPGTLLYVYYGKLAGDVASLASGAGAAAERGAGYWAVMMIGLAATLAVTAVVTRLARRALREDLSY